MSQFIERRLEAGQTLRYHTVPEVGRGQNVAAHSWRAIVLMHSLWPDKVTRLNPVLHLLYHDAAEQTLGDIPAPAKWRFREMYHLYEYAEKEINEELEVRFNLTEDEQVMCSIVDMLECMDHVGNAIIRGDHSFEAKTIYWNGRRSLVRKFSTHDLYFQASKYILSLDERVCSACPSVVNGLP